MYDHFPTLTAARAVRKVPTPGMAFRTFFRSILISVALTGLSTRKSCGCGLIAVKILWVVAGRSAMLDVVSQVSNES